MGLDASAAPPGVSVSLPTATPFHVTAESLDNLAASLIDIAKTHSVEKTATLEGVANSGGQPQPLNRLDSFGAGVVINVQV